MLYLECDARYYGPGCESKCDCQNGAACDHVSGACTCTEGWRGLSCDKPCPNGFYGLDCTNRCMCGKFLCCVDICHTFHRLLLSCTYVFMSNKNSLRSFGGQYKHLWRLKAWRNFPYRTSEAVMRYTYCCLSNLMFSKWYTHTMKFILSRYVRKQFGVCSTDLSVFIWLI